MNGLETCDEALLLGSRGLRPVNEADASVDGLTSCG